MSLLADGLIDKCKRIHFYFTKVTMDKKGTPNYYAIVPAPVRYAKDLSEFQKLLYAKITALSQKDGFCYASNNYFFWTLWQG